MRQWTNWEELHKGIKITQKGLTWTINHSQLLLTEKK